jgi:WXG100 family type VII secretion target
MDAFDVELQALPQAKAETDQVHSELAQAVGDVRSSVGDLVDGRWRGPAASAFTAGFDEWCSGAAEVLRALTAMSNLLTTTEQTYEVSDTGVAALHERLGGQL